jgi:hypothetical protein
LSIYYNENDNINAVTFYITSALPDDPFVNGLKNLSSDKGCQLYTSKTFHYRSNTSWESLLLYIDLKNNYSNSVIEKLKECLTYWHGANEANLSKLLGQMSDQSIVLLISGYCRENNNAPYPEALKRMFLISLGIMYNRNTRRIDDNDVIQINAQNQNEETHQTASSHKLY